MRLNEQKRYLDGLERLVGCHVARKFEIDEDEGSGAWVIDFNEHTPGRIAPHFIIYASPFWEGAEGIPVELLNEDGDRLARLELPFRRSGDIDRDATHFVRVVNLLPELLHDYLSGNGRPPIDPRLLDHDMFDPGIYESLKEQGFTDQDIIDHCDEVQKDLEESE
jgi:hypothetical protein